MTGPEPVRTAGARRLLPCGAHAVLVEVGDLEGVLALTDAITSAITARRPGFTAVVDVVPAAATVLVIVDDEAGTEDLTEGLRRLEVGEASGGRASGGPETVIPVRYDGPDLDDVARLTGLTPADVVAAHTATPWRVAFGGFAPGFAYLTGGDPRLRVRRRSTPRTSVPAGAVALAGGFSAIYPQSSPGGWQLIGLTDTVMFDPAREPAALLRPGDRVRFVEAGAAHG